MDILFPIAGMHLNVFLVAGLGAVVGFLSGFCGVGGGFLLVPLLMMAGVSPAVAAASDANRIAAASVAGSLGQSRVGNVDWKLALLLVAGGLAGGLAGTGLVHHLRASGNLDFVIQVSYVVFLLAVGSNMLYGSTGSLKPRKRAGVPLLARPPGQIYFGYADRYASAYALLGLGFLAGVLAALLGVGGGFIMLPVLIYLAGVPTGIAVGTSLVAVFFTAAEVTFAQSTVNHTVDLLLALVLLAGSGVGTRFGVRIGRQWKGGQLRGIFALIVLGMMGKMLYGLLGVPGAVIPLPAIPVPEAGLGGYLSFLAANQGALYGVLAVSAALLAGLGLNGLFGGLDAARGLLRRKTPAAEVRDPGKKVAREAGV